MRARQSGRRARHRRQLTCSVERQGTTSKLMMPTDDIPAAKGAVGPLQY